MSGQKVIQKVTSNGGAVTVAPQPQQPGQCVQVSQAMIGTQPTAQIISPLQVCTHIIQSRKHSHNTRKYNICRYTKIQSTLSNS